ncbi:MAG: WG repeat-containing protein [Bacteroides sp.]|nr:WG repeat-containing protein [Bacteroides sp.]
MNHKERFTTFAILTLLCLAMISCNSKGEVGRYFAVKFVDSDQWSIVDVKAKKIIYEDEFENQPSFIVNGKFCIKNDSDLYDYYTIDNPLKPINSESYLYTSMFNVDDIALAVKKGEGISIIDGKCKKIAYTEDWIHVYGFSHGYSAFSDENDNRGILNTDLEVVIPAKFDYVSHFSEDGYAIVKDNARYSIIDTSCSKLFSFPSSKYKDIGLYIGGYLPVQKENNEIMLLDGSGMETMSLGIWDESAISISDIRFFDDLIVYKEGRYYGLKDKGNNIVLRAKYEQLVPQPLYPKYYVAKKGDNYGLIDKDDNIIIPFDDYSVLNAIDKDVFLVGDLNTFSFKDKTLKDLIPRKFTDVSTMRGTYDIRSNYFNVKKEVKEILSNITDSTFFNTNRNTTFRDFSHILSIDGDVCIYNFSSILHDKHDSFDVEYDFGSSPTICDSSYIYIHGVPFIQVTPVKYDYDRKLESVHAIKNYEEFQPGSEESLADAFEFLVQREGFTPVDHLPHWFVNDKENMYIGLSYNEGEVTIRCDYKIPSYYGNDIERKSRENYTPNDN